MKTITILLATLSLGLQPLCADEMLFPQHPSVLRATDFGVDLADNGHDDTEALQKAISQHLTDSPRKLLYLPAGVYNLSKPIRPVRNDGKEHCRQARH